MPCMPTSYFVIDINECEEAMHSCQPPKECTNTPGGYKCICGEGFRLDENRVNCTHTLSTGVDTIALIESLNQ